LGYFNDWLFAFPQLDVALDFGDVVRQAKADFTVLDITSYYRMAIIEDKRQENETLNSEPQLIAEAIAIHQQNMMTTNEIRKRKRTESSSASSSSSSSASCSSSDVVVEDNERTAYHWNACERKHVLFLRDSNIQVNIVIYGDSIINGRED